MSNLHVHNLLESLNEEEQQSKEEKKALELLEKQLLEKQQRERILEQLALKNTEAAKETTQDLATVHQTTRTTLKNPESIHRDIEKRYQEQIIKKLTESIEASITKKLNK